MKDQPQLQQLDLLTPRGVAKLIGVGKNTVIRAINHGELGAIIVPGEARRRLLITRYEAERFRAVRANQPKRPGRKRKPS